MILYAKLTHILLTLSAVLFLIALYHGGVWFVAVSKEVTFEDIKRLPIDHALLLQYLKKNILKPPSILPYPKNILTGNPSEYRDVIRKIFKGKKGGFFIDCGAHDGNFLSNTWALERDFGWSGLLIEVQPQLYKKLKARNRKAWLANVCVSPHNNVSEIDFLVNVKQDHLWLQGLGKLDMKDDVVSVKIDPHNSKRTGFIVNGKVLCFPLLTIMQAIGVTHVDYFSLDVQGVEFKILKTLPFDDRLIIDVLQAEHSLDPEGKESMRSFMESKGYKVVYQGENDYIFKRLITNKSNSSN